MKSIKTIFLSILLMAFIGSYADVPGEVPNEIILALKSGNAKELSKYFNANIELQILDEEDIYSKSQAELIMKNFFSNNIPSGFTKIHEGGKEGAKYVIGNIATSTGIYRVYFLLKEKGGKVYIHELRIEDE